jgi:tripartite-type tricarboxylate transporter receptor subunit TctC
MTGAMAQILLNAMRALSPIGTQPMQDFVCIRSRAVIVAASGLIALACSAGNSRADGVEDFYKGKTINLMIGYSVGGGYDLYGRLLSRHLGKHIPGHPSVVPQNMTGAGSLRAAQFIYSVAPKDGTAIATFGRTIPTTPLLTPGSAQFDGTKFTWLGSITNEVSACVTSRAAKAHNWEELLKNEVTVGGEGPGADPDVYTRLYNNVFGTKMKLVTGYHGTNDMTLAMERGEIDGVCGLSWSTLKARHMQAMKDKQIYVVIQAALKKQPELADVPLAIDLTKDPEKLQILKLFLASQEMARPFAAPPDLPADRKAALVKAFDETMKDPEFLAEAQKQSMDVNPLSPKEIEDILVDLYKTPKPVLEKAALAISK